jgi:hypothetical protein
MTPDTHVATDSQKSVLYDIYYRNSLYKELLRISHVIIDKQRFGILSCSVAQCC